MKYTVETPYPYKFYPCKTLAEDGTEEAKEWLCQIASELNLIDMDYHDCLEIDEWLKEFI